MEKQSFTPNDQENHNEKKDPNIKDHQKNINRFAHYGSLGLSMVIMIAGFSYAGYWLDQKINTEKPYFTILMVMISTIGMIYRLYRFTQTDFE